MGEELAGVFEKNEKKNKTTSVYRLYRLRPIQNGRKRIKIKTMTEICQISQARVFVAMRIEFNLRRNLQFYRFRTFYSGQSKTHQNVSVDANRSMFFQ